MRYELVYQFRDEKRIRLLHGTKDFGQQLTELETLRRNCAEEIAVSVKSGTPIKPDDQSVMVLIFLTNHRRAGNEILI
jgi:hypothetical protein